MENEEFRTLANELALHGSIFYRIWNLGRPTPDPKVQNKINIRFDPNGRTLGWSYNPEAWGQLNFKQKLFYICHACTHILYMHGIRAIPMKNKEYANIAMDLVTNEMLITDMDFNRSEVDPNGQLYWIADVLPDVSRKLSFETYYEILNNQQMDVAGQQADDHNFGDDGFGSYGPSGPSLEDILQQNKVSAAFAETLQETIGEDEVKEFLREKSEEASAAGRGPQSEGKMAGHTAGQLGIEIAKQKVIKKKKWETIIKKWSRRFYTETEEEQWARPPRRLASLPSDFILPSEIDGNEYDKSRIKVWFFLDTSGSCSGLGPRWFKAAESLPEDKFDLKLFCFDTKVYKTDIKSRKLYGYGGTQFSILSDYVNASEDGHPDACFVLTDGYGDKIEPAQPKKWYFFLTEDYRDCLPKESNIFRLRDFE